MMDLEAQIPIADVNTTTIEVFQRQIRLYFLVISVGWPRTIDQIKIEENARAGIPQVLAPPVVHNHYAQRTQYQGYNRPTYGYPNEAAGYAPDQGHRGRGGARGGKRGGRGSRRV